MRMLYREGDSQLIWGDIPCDFIVVAEDEVDTYLADGWKSHPFDLYKDEVKADADGDGELSLDEAKAYLDSVGVDYAGLHWKKVVVLAKEKSNGSNKG